MKNKISCLFVLFVVLGFCSVVSAETDPNGVEGDVGYSFDSAPVSGGCGWFPVIDRDGIDGGYLTVELTVVMS